MSISTPTTSISAVSARKQFGDLLNRTFYQKEVFVVERAGKPRAVIIPITQYQDLELRKQEAKAQIAQSLNESRRAFANISENDKDNLIQEAIGWVRRQKVA